MDSALASEASGTGSTPVRGTCLAIKDNPKMDYWTQYWWPYSIKRALVLILVPIVILFIAKIFFPNAYKKQMEVMRKRDYSKVMWLRIILGILFIAIIWLYINSEKQKIDNKAMLFRYEEKNR